MLKLIIIILLIMSVISPITAWPFDPEPTPDPNITWEPVDKVWVFQPAQWDATDNYICIPAGIIFYVTYKSSQDVYEIRKVDVTTWYNSPPRTPLGNTYVPMYFQGALP